MSSGSLTRHQTVLRVELVKLSHNKLQNLLQLETLLAYATSLGFGYLR